MAPTKGSEMLESSRLRLELTMKGPICDSTQPLYVDAYYEVGVLE